MTQHIYITGTGRCGTNNVKQLLNCSNEVFSLPFEPRFMIDPDGVFDFINTIKHGCCPYSTDVAFSRLKTLLHDVTSSSRTNNYQAWELDHHMCNFSKHVETLLIKINPIQYTGKWSRISKHKTMSICSRDYDYYVMCVKEFYNNLINDTLKNKSKRLYVDDSTWMCLYCDTMREIIPESLFIYVHRDPRDIIRSFMEQSWMPDDVESCAIIYNKLYNQWKNKSNNLSKNTDYIEIMFEEFFTSHKRVVAKINKACKLELTTDDVSSVFQKEKANIGLWKQTFSSSDLSIIDDCLDLK